MIEKIKIINKDVGQNSRLVYQTHIILNFSILIF